MNKSIKLKNITPIVYFNGLVGITKVSDKASIFKGIFRKF